MSLKKEKIQIAVRKEVVGCSSTVDNFFFISLFSRLCLCMFMTCLLKNRSNYKYTITIHSNNSLD